ncbi:heme-thiolate peroxidase [Gymnopilus junonius]|uniref:Heme-thiolate peroxidase n=1 Tax=Gymnopilus junonius TaxID=109634 RepID=A0A9P5NRC7_GYMJU|nr:heme-thiolate peroxidase [Gymnopilus junonius]
MMRPTITRFLVLSSLALKVFAFPAFASLAGFSGEVLQQVIPTLELRVPPKPPGPLKDTSAKLVNDAAHPWKPLEPGDIRGPCPGLNTLASHGYLPRNGIASPSQIVEAAQEGFNMHNGLAIFITYAGHLVDGNLLTDLLSIGGKTSLTGPDPPGPATVGGLNTHDVFEGDTSMTRGDAFFGNNHSFNETLFNELVEFSNRFGGGKYNFTVASEFRWKRIQDSIATNPNMSFVSPRYFTAYAESTFPINFFIDGRLNTRELDLTVARGFFQHSRMPDGFFRPNRSMGGQGMELVADPHPIQPGRNVGGVNNYVIDPTSADFSTFCLLYENVVKKTIKGLYPRPTGVLRRALDINLDYLFQGFTLLNGNGPDACKQVFPYEKDD